MPTAPPRPRGLSPERTAILRIMIALGLAMLLAVGAWSSAHGTADSHAAGCIASGSAAAATGDASGAGEASVTAGPLTSDSGSALLAALCCFLLALLFVRLVGGYRRLRLRIAVRTVALRRTGPTYHPRSPSIRELSLSRT